MERMRGLFWIAFMLAELGATAHGWQKGVDKIIDIGREGNKVTFVERTKEKAEVVTVVVGQTVRWVNKDDREHRLVSDLKVEDKPLFVTGVIPAGEHKDLVFDFDLYRKAGGKPANVIKLKYHAVGKDGGAVTDQEAGELQVLSAARRSFGRP